VSGLIPAQPAQAQTYKLLYSFHGWDGTNPDAGLVRDTAGNLYGTAQWGGTYDNGTVYELNKKGSLTLLYSFCPNGDGCTDGSSPVGGLIRDTQGNLYGTTAGGGSSNNGVVFTMNTGGTETVLYSFAGGATDGCIPQGNLLRDKTGNLYGITDSCGAFGYGTVFMLDTTGTETVLHSFTGGADGTLPSAGLIRDSHGNLYGVTTFGGVGLNCYGGASQGCGVVYKLRESGTLTVLHSFTGGTTDGCYPEGTPAMDKDGNLYGTTVQCGSSYEGIVWKVSKKGTETVLHNLAGGSSDGAYPVAGVILDAKGHLYGDTEEGGAYGYGTVYELRKKALTLLHSFAGSDGEYPVGGLIRDNKGNLYGTTYIGGNPQWVGTVWKLTL